MAEDYYKVLGVAKDVAADTIKKAYRKLALKYHPDRNQGDKKAEERCKTVNEAYAVLSDAEKRKQYDMFGAEGFSQRFSQEDIFRGSNLNDILKEFGLAGGEDLFSQLFGGAAAGRGAGRRSQRGGFEFFTGGGAQAPFGAHGDSCSYKQHYTGGTHQPVGEDLVCDLTVTLEEAALGSKKTVTLQYGNKQEHVSVKIPAGIKAGQRLRVSGKGSLAGGQAGDLYIRIKIAPHPEFTRQEDDLYTEKSVLPSQALLGDTIEVPTLKGSKRIKLPAGSSSGRKIRLKGYGVKRLRSGGHGDLYVKIAIKVPAVLSKSQKEAAKKLSAEGL